MSPIDAALYRGTAVCAELRHSSSSFASVIGRSTGCGGEHMLSKCFSMHREPPSVGSKGPVDAIGSPCLAAGLRSADRSVSTPPLVMVVECWSGHPPVPVVLKRCGQKAALSIDVSTVPREGCPSF